MPTVTFTQPSGATDVVHVDDGTTLMRAAVTNNVPGIVGECGGQAMCATCHVFIRPEFVDALAPVGEDEDEMLDCTSAARTDRSRLGCQVHVDGELDGIVVDVPDGQV